MTVFLAQPEFKRGLMAPTGAMPRIPGMRKKGTAYQRAAKAEAAPEEVPHKIRQWREWFDWSQEVLAEKSGLSVSAISAYERGVDNPKLDKLDMLSKAFKVPRGMLLDVDPNDDEPLWASVLRTTMGQSPPGKPKK